MQSKQMLLIKPNFMNNFSHIDTDGQVRMVDVTDKTQSLRIATACGIVNMKPETLEIIENNSAKKGNVIETARIAGIMAAKKAWELIPMCHPLNITHVALDFFPDKASSSLKIEASVKIFFHTGVEMEALTAVSVAALTIYDMCKSFDRKMTINKICLLEKSGGRSGKFLRDRIL